MNRTEENYLELLRLGLWGSDKGFGNDSRARLTMDEFMVARRQATSGIVSRYSDDELFRNEVTYLKLLRYSHTAALSDIKSRLDSAGIPFVLLKGLGCDFYYPDSGLRDLGDIDVYVGEENYDVVAGLFGRDPSASGSPKHFSFELDGVTVEVHRCCEIMASRKAGRCFNSLATEGLGSQLTVLDIDCVAVNTPSDNFNAVYLFTHFFNHFLGGGCGLRQVCDWLLFLHAKSSVLDTEYLAASLEGLGLMNAWKTFGAMAVSYLGMPAGEMPFYDPRLTRRGSRLLHIILDMGNFGSSRKQERRKRFGTGFFARKLGSLLGALYHSAEMLTLFPVHSLRGITHALVSSSIKTARQIVVKVSDKS